MAIEDFFRHKCDIYHAVKSPKTANYGLPNSEQVITYPNEPSVTDSNCFFDTVNTSANISEVEPMHIYSGANQLSLPVGTSINYNDKVVDIRFGHEYTAGYPENIRGHYIVVPVFRKTRQEAL